MVVPVVVTLQHRHRLSQALAASLAHTPRAAVVLPVQMVALALPVEQAARVATLTAGAVVTVAVVVARRRRHPQPVVQAVRVALVAVGAVAAV